MDNTSVSLRPISAIRPRGAHRFECFSIKLNRRVTYYRRAALEQWIVLETEPKVRTFCERPGSVQVDGQVYLADFWVRYQDRQECLLLEVPIPASDRKMGPVFKADAWTIRHIPHAELSAARIWIENWHRMLPCLIASRRYISDTLCNNIEDFLHHPSRLLDIEREFSTGDPILIRATVFSLLHAGRVVAPELKTHELSLLTSFAIREMSS